MIDRRTNLAGQIINGMFSLGVEDWKEQAPIAVVIADTVLAELQRTCPKHDFPSGSNYDVNDQFSHYTYSPCSQCGAEKPSGGIDAE